MKIKIVNNKYLNSLLLLMLISAIIHMVILFYVAITSNDSYWLNYFNILDLDLLFGTMFNSLSGNLFSTVVAGIIYLVILYVNRTE